MSSSPYDSIAGMYHALWADWYLPAALPALERLFFSALPPGASILDLCCGSGHVTKELVRRGYRVTGFDASEELIKTARREISGAIFQVGDARELRFPPQFRAVLSTFDSLNHVLALQELRKVFAGVYDALLEGGLFVFDMNLEEAYLQDLRRWAVTVDDQHVTLVRGTYDCVEKLAVTELIWFALEAESGLWRRFNSFVEERCYQAEEIRTALVEAGFHSVTSARAADAGMEPSMAHGRLFYSARKLSHYPRAVAS